MTSCARRPVILPALAPLAIAQSVRASTLVPATRTMSWRPLAVTSTLTTAGSWQSRSATAPTCAEAKSDAIYDIATLTGSASRALGLDVAAVLGNDQAAVDRAIAAGEAAGEPLWQLPLHRPYLRMLDSDTADIANCAAIGLP